MFVNFYKFFLLVTISNIFQVINLTGKKAANASVKWNDVLNSFEKLMLLKALQEEKVSPYRDLVQLL